MSVYKKTQTDKIIEMAAYTISIGIAVVFLIAGFTGVMWG